MEVRRNSVNITERRYRRTGPQALVWPCIILLSNYKVTPGFLIIFCRDSCAINLGSTVLITGGLEAKTKVSEYSEDNFVRYHPELQYGRWNHGCSYFNDDEGTKVDT